MRHAFLRAAFALTLALCFAGAATAQDTPGTVKFPAATDSQDSLIRATNSARTTLSSGISAGVTTIPVASTASFPASGAAAVDNEIFFYSGKTPTSFTGVTRGADSTTAASHLATAAVRGVVTAAHHNTVAQAVIAVETKLGSGSSTPASGKILVGTGPGASEWDTLDESHLPASPTFTGNVTAPTFTGSLVGNVQGSTTVSGTVTATAFVGNGAGITGLAGATGGVANTGSTTIGADTDIDLTGVIDFQTKGVTRLRIDNDGALIEYGPLTGTNLAAVVASYGSFERTVKITTPQTVATGFTAPANITLQFEGEGSVTVATGQTLTVQGPFIAPPTKHVLRNIGTGMGALSITGNKYINEMFPEWLGGKNDNSTDNVAPIQTIINVFAAAGKNPVVRFQEGKYLLSAAAQDTGASNAQLVLPKVSTMASQLTVHFKGASTPSHPWNTDSGTILRSTLTTAGANVIGVKNNQGSSEATASARASNISSNIIFSAEDITLRLPANPAPSALDISRIRNAHLKNVRLDTDDYGQGGLNPVVFSGTVIPSPTATEPTTSSSFALKLPVDFLTNHVDLNNVFIAGYYNGIRTGELAHGRGIVMHNTKVGFSVEGATWPSYFQSVILGSVKTAIKTAGATADLAGLPGANTNATIYFEDVGIENTAGYGPSWADTTYVVDDSPCYLKGRLRVFYGAGETLPVNLGCRELAISRSERPWNTRDPITNITGVDLNAANMAVDETYRGVQVSDNTAMAWKVTTCNQLGTSHGCGIFAVANDAIPNLQDKRLAYIYGQTDGSIKSGSLSFFTMAPGATPSDPGTPLNRGLFDHYGNFIIFHPLWTDGQSLSISGGAIAPTKPVVHVGPGVLSNMTVPPKTAAAGVPGFITIRLVAGATPFTTNTSGNFANAVTPAAHEPVDCTWSPDTSKWHCK